MQNHKPLFIFAIVFLLISFILVYSQSIPKFEIDRSIATSMSYHDSLTFCFSPESSNHKVIVDDVEYCMNTYKEYSQNRGYLFNDCPPFELIPNGEKTIVNVTNILYNKNDISKSSLTDCAITLINHVEAGIHELRPRDLNKKSWDS